MHPLRSFVLLPILLAACAGTASLPRPEALPPDGAEVEALLEDFYGKGLSPEAARAQADLVLAKHPRAARAHEVAAYAALLAGDDEARWAHFRAAAEDPRADAPELYLYELGADAPSHLEDLRGLLERMRISHPRPDVRALAAHHLARLLLRRGEPEAARRVASQVGAIWSWQVLGAFDNDQGKGFYTAFAPELGIDLAAEVPGALVPVRWRQILRSTHLGKIALDDLLWPKEFAIAYLATWVHVDAARTAQLRLTTASPARVFVNEGLAASEEQITSADFDNLVVPIALKAGWNQVLIKSAHRRGGWELLARITDEAGGALPGLRYAVTQQPIDKAEAPRPAAIEPRKLTGPEARRRWIEARLLRRDGRKRAALSSLQPLVEDHEHNPLYQYYAALSYWDNEELGKAIDLLNRGVAETQARAGAILTKRGRFYSQKQIWEKAEADLGAAVALSPHAFEARVEQAELYEHRGWTVDRCRALEEMARTWPEDAAPLRERAKCTLALGYAEQADQLLIRAAEQLPGDVETHRQRLDLARRRSDHATVRREIATLKRLQPGDPRWVLEEAELARRLGDRAAAEERYRAALALQPDQPRAWERLGALAYERGQKKEALAAWRKAHTCDPNNAALAQQIEHLEPTRLGFVERYVPSEVEIDRALETKVNAHPGAQTALLLDHEVVEVNADGSARRIVTQVGKALDEKGRDELTSRRLPRDGAVKVMRAYALSERGDRQEASSIRGSEVRFRTLQVGSRIVLQYVYYMPPPHFLPGAFVGNWFFQGPGEQNEDSTWVLVLPRGRKLHAHVRGAVAQRRADEGDREVHVFHAAKQPPLVPEPGMSPVVDLAARVEVSTVESWDDYVRWERALLADAFRASPSLDALADKLVAEAKSPREKLDLIYHHVTQKILYQQDYENTIAGVRPHAATAVVERGYGDCKDKSVLLIQLARRVGLSAHFAILRTTPHGKVTREVPNQQFNHAIVYVPAQPGIETAFFLDPTAEGLDIGNLRSDDQGAVSLVLDPFGASWSFIEIPYQDSGLTYDQHKIRIAVRSPTEVEVEDAITFRGMMGMALRRVMRNRGEAKKVYQSLAAMLLPGASVREVKPGDATDTWHPLVLGFALDAGNAVRSEDDRFRLAMPVHFQLEKAITLKERETPLHMGPPESSRFEVEVSLAEGLDIAHAPKDFSVEHACFSASRKASVVGRRMSLQYAYTRRCTEIAPDAYGKFRVAAQEAARRLNDDLVFGKLAPVTKPAPRRTPPPRASR